MLPYPVSYAYDITDSIEKAELFSSLVTATVFPSVFPSLINPATVKRRLAETNVDRVV